MGCFWNKIFHGVRTMLQRTPILGTILQVAAGAICGSPCAALAAAFVTGVTSGDLGLAIRAGLTAYFTAEAFNAVGNATGHRPDFGTANHVANIAGHALVGCASSVAQGGRCGQGALSGAVGSFASPILRGMDFTSGLVAHAVVGGLASVAAGGNFANGAVTASFGYLFNFSRCMPVRCPDDIVGGGGGGGSPEWGRQLGRAITGFFASILGGDTDDPYQTIYRAIGDKELATLQATGTYGFSPNASGKYFALARAGVYQFANSSFNAGQNMTITSTSIPSSVLNSGYEFNDPGGGRMSVHFSDPQLPKVYSTMTPVQILPRRP
jgi:hypothetical protein